MPDRRIVEVQPDGLTEFVHFDPDGNITGFQWTSDAEAVIEENKIAQTDGNKGYGETREWQHVGRIELGALMEYCQLKGIPLHLATGGGKESLEVLLRFLKDRDYMYFRRDI